MKIEENLPKNITFHLPPGRESGSPLVKILFYIYILPATIIVFNLMSWLLPVTPLTQLLSFLSPFPNDIAVMQNFIYICLAGLISIVLYGILTRRYLVKTLIIDLWNNELILGKSPNEDRYDIQTIKYFIIDRIIITEFRRAGQKGQPKECFSLLIETHQNERDLIYTGAIDYVYFSDSKGRTTVEELIVRLAKALQIDILNLTGSEEELISHEEAEFLNVVPYQIGKKII